MRRRQSGFTLIELTVVLAVMATLAAVTVPSAVRAHGAAATEAGAQRLAVTLRLAQARAQARGERVRVTIVDGGHGYEVDERCEGVWRCAERVALGAPLCTTNFPNGVVEFDSRGWPHAAGGASPRAGSFVVAWATSQRTVVVQLIGRVRCR